MSVYTGHRLDKSGCRRSKGVNRRFLVSLFFFFAFSFFFIADVAWAEEKMVADEEIGILVSEITEDFKKELNLDDTNGVLVLRVLPGWPADEGGINPGDVILGIADTAVKNIEDYEEASKKLKGQSDFNIMVRTREGMFSFIQIISRE